MPFISHFSVHRASTVPTISEVEYPIRLVSTIMPRLNSNNSRRFATSEQAKVHTYPPDLRAQALSLRMSIMLR